MKSVDDPRLNTVVIVQTHRGCAATVAAAHPRPVRSVWRADEALDVTFHPDSRLLAAAYHDHTARIWDTHTGTEVAPLRRTARVWGQ